MKHKLITFIPVYNGEKWLPQTLESVARQTLRPDRVIVSDNRSTDGTERFVKEFKGIAVEWQQNESNLGPGKNMNKGFAYAAETDFLHILHADDVLDPKFYETMTNAFDGCAGRGIGWCLDERIDENNERLSVSGTASGQVEVLSRDKFLQEKAEIGNQACSGTLLKTAYQPAPCEFPLEFPSVGDMLFYPRWGMTCEKILRVHQPLLKYRWHGMNDSNTQARDLNALVCQEWDVMQLVEQLRGHGPGFVRTLKLMALFGVRSGIKAKRFKERGNMEFSRKIVQVTKERIGWWLWFSAWLVVETRDIVVYGILRRRKHPGNIFS
jgi:glycosyltransferase involved in cell wall biosynthesis